MRNARRHSGSAWLVACLCSWQVRGAEPPAAEANRVIEVTFTAAAELADDVEAWLVNAGAIRR